MFIDHSAQKKAGLGLRDRPLQRHAMWLGSVSGNTNRRRCASASMGNARKGIGRNHIGSGTFVACSRRPAAERNVPEQRSVGRSIRGCSNRRARPCGTSLRLRVVVPVRRRAALLLPLSSLGSQIFSPNCPPRRNAYIRRLAFNRDMTVNQLYNTRMPSAHVC